MEGQKQEATGREKERKKEGRREGGGKPHETEGGKASFYLLCFATRCKILSRSSALNPALKYRSRS